MCKCDKCGKSISVLGSFNKSRDNSNRISILSKRADGGIYAKAYYVCDECSSKFTDFMKNVTE